jgi:pyruvyl transferase EpsO
MHDFSRRDRDNEAAVVLKPSIRDLDRMVARAKPVLVLHGGGNFGDIWPQFQMFRELIIQRYSGTPIVILPQSIHFDGRDARDRAARILAAHNKVTVFVRDEESLGFVRQDAGVDGEIVPDMAHQLWGRPGFAVNNGAGTLVMRRRDREKHDAVVEAGNDFDWGELTGETSRVLLRALRKWQTVDNPLRRVVPNESLWRVYRDRLIRRAVERFRPYACIDTDRLHGMILAALMSKKVRYSEGSYGKLHRYARRWFSDSDLIESCRLRVAAE